jgi:hypothetical protein
MESIKAPKTIKVYQLIRQTGMSMISAGSGTAGLGIGFYSTQSDAEQNRTMEILRDTSTGTGVNKPKFHLFELEMPNPAYTEL